jgi:hypothetical protein
MVVYGPAQGCVCALESCGGPRSQGWDKYIYIDIFIYKRRLGASLQSTVIVSRELDAKS